MRSVDDASRGVVQAHRVVAVDGDLGAAHIEGHRVKLVPAHRCRHLRLPLSARNRNVVLGGDLIGEIMPRERRDQAQGRLVCFHRDLHQVQVHQRCGRAPEQAVADPLDLTCVLQ